MQKVLKRPLVPIIVTVLTAGSYLFSLTLSSLADKTYEKPPTLNDDQALQFDQQAAVKKLRQRIAGKEDQAAEKVFKNIQRFKGVRADRLLTIMERGLVNYLGVNCTHCHVAEQWEKDDNPKKQISREMGVMMAGINEQLLTGIKNLKSPRAAINCMTCHQGKPIPPYLAQPAATPAASPSLKREN